LDGSGTVIDEDYVVNGNMSIRAKWEEDWVQVKMNGNGGVWNKYNLFDEEV
jgi:hypothetical protein